MSLTMGSHVGAATARARTGTAAPTGPSSVEPAPASVPATPEPAVTGFRHEGVAWSGADQLLACTLPFVTDGLDVGDDILVALSPDLATRLRDALGPDADRVRFVDPDTSDRSPARRLQGWLDLISTHDGIASADRRRRRTGGPRLRALTEPVRADHRAPEVTEAHLHEAVLNLAIPAVAPLSLMCLYDAEAVGSEVLAEACRTHPRMTPSGAGARSHQGPGYAQRLTEHPLPEPTAEPGSIVFTAGGLSLVRHRVARVAAGQGVAAARIDDLTVAVNEVAANSLDHGGGRGVLRYWTEPGAVVFEVRDSGRISDPLVGRISPESGQSRGRGLWMAHQCADLLQLRSDGAGTTARVTTWI